MTEISLKCCFGFLQVIVLLISCFKELWGIVVITPVPVNLFNDTDGRNCSDIISGIPQISVAPDSIDYTGKFPRQWINKTHEIMVPMPKRFGTNRSSLPKETDSSPTEKPDLIKEANQNFTLTPSLEIPAATTFQTSSPPTAFSKLIPALAATEPESSQTVSTVNPFTNRNMQDLKMFTTTPKSISLNAGDASHKSSLTSQTYTIKSVFPLVKDTSSVRITITMLNSTSTLNSKKSHKFTNKVSATASENSLLKNNIPLEYSAKHVDSSTKHSKLHDKIYTLPAENTTVFAKAIENSTKPSISETSGNQISEMPTDSIESAMDTLKSTIATLISNFITPISKALEPLYPSKSIENSSTKRLSSNMTDNLSTTAMSYSEQLVTPSHVNIKIASLAKIKKDEPVDASALEKELDFKFASPLPLGLDPDLLYLWRAPYLQRLRHANHEMVDEILQSEIKTPPEPHECPYEYQELVLINLQRILGLLLLSLPQSLKEVEEIMWNPELENYLFRPQERAIFDVTTCKGSCYIMSQDICREIFGCKNGKKPGPLPRLTAAQLERLRKARSG